MRHSQTREFWSILDQKLRVVTSQNRSYLKKRFSRMSDFLTRAWPGGGRLTPPPSRIFAIAQKRTALSTWNLAGLLIQQFDIVRGNFFEIRRKNFEIWSILWRHYTPLLVESWPNFAGLWKTQFLIKTQMKNTKRRKMRSSTRWLSRFFSKFWVFDP